MDSGFLSGKLFLHRLDQQLPHMHVWSPGAHESHGHVWSWTECPVFQHHTPYLHVLSTSRNHLQSETRRCIYQAADSQQGYRTWLENREEEGSWAKASTTKPISAWANSSQWPPRQLYWGLSWHPCSCEHQSGPPLFPLIITGFPPPFWTQVQQRVFSWASIFEF